MLSKMRLFLVNIKHTHSEHVFNVKCTGNSCEEKCVFNFLRIMVAMVGGRVSEACMLFKKAFAFRVFLLSDMAVGMVMRPQIYPKAL